MVIESLVNCIDLRLQHGKDVHRFIWLAGAAIGKRVVRPHEARRTVLVILAIADRVGCPIKVPSKAVNLAVSQTKLIFKLELVVGGGSLMAICQGQSDRVSNEAVLCICKYFECASVIIRAGHFIE